MLNFIKSHSELLSDLIDNSNDMIFIINMDSLTIQYANKTVLEELQYTFEELQSLRIEGFRRSFEGEAAFSKIITLLRAQNHITDFATIVRKDGSTFPAEARVKILHIDEASYALAIVSNITTRVESQNSLKDAYAQMRLLVDERTSELQEQVAQYENYKQVMDESSIVSRSSLEGFITYVNDAFTKISGYSKIELLGRPHNIVRHPDMPASLFKALWKTIQAKKVWKGILKNRKKDGGYYWVDMVIKPIFDKDNNITEYIAVRHDITEMMDQREKLTTLAYTNSLTGLPNRAKYREEINTFKKPAVALLNLDAFSRTNDFYGHNFGDIVLKVLGEKIKEYMPKHYRLYHLNADEFLILSEDEDRTIFANYIRFIIENLRSQSITISNERIVFDVSGSISFEDRNVLLATADIALKRVKKLQDQMLIYNSNMEIKRDYEQNLYWSHKLRQALNDGRIVPFFQPIVNNHTGVYDKYEALVRLIDEDGTVYSPYHFLDVAHRTKQYRQITKAMLLKTIETLKTCDAAFSVNLSIDDILDSEIRTFLLNLLDYSDFGNRLVIELLETEGIINFEGVSEFINKMKAHGCKIAVDDFGTGYSNFNYLIKLQVDFVKIDGSIIQTIHEKSSRILVETIVTFTKAMGIKTIAEFVSDKTILEQVKALGINYSQGYYFSPPQAHPIC